MKRVILVTVLTFAMAGAVSAAQPEHHRRHRHNRMMNAEHVRAVQTSGTIEDGPDDFPTEDEWQHMSDADRANRRRRWILRRYLPEGGTPDPARLQDYLARFEQENVYDKRNYLFHVRAIHDPKTTGDVVLTGEVSVPEFHSGLVSSLRLLGFNITKDDIQDLPSKELGEKIYGLSTTAVATMRREPRGRAEQVNSVALGGWVRLLRKGRTDDVTSTSVGRHHAPRTSARDTAPNPNQWYLAQTLEGYIGFMRAEDLELHKDFTVPDGIVEIPTTVTVEGKAQQLPAGAFVYANGKSWKTWRGEALPPSVHVQSLAPHITAEQILAEMKPFMDTHYVWGGTTDSGIDCSGFTQFFLRLRGVSVARDAAQQATGGLIVAWGKDIPAKAKPGDIIFFKDEGGRISHVAISLGGSKLIHSSGPGVHLSDLSDSHHGEGTLVDSAIFARRIAVR